MIELLEEYGAIASSIGLIIGILGFVLTILNFLGFVKWNDLHESTKKIIKWIFLLIIFISTFGIGYSMKHHNESKIRIAVLLPLDRNKHDSPPYQDGKRQAYGYIDLIEKYPDLLDEFEIIFKNHGMNTDKAIEIVTSELKLGTNYFISTMSQVSERLSANFQSLVIEHKKNKIDNPKLIITVTSSNKIILKKDLIYRFYIRSEEESKLLSNYYIDNILSDRIVAITVDDNYGNRAKEIFCSEMHRPFDLFIPLQIDWNFEKIKNEISLRLGNNRVKNQTFFIVHYGNGLDNIITSLYELNQSGILLLSHPITVKEWNYPIIDILEKFQWITCFVESKNGGIYNSDDIIRDFTFFSLERLIHTIKSSQNTGSTFDECWKALDEPKDIAYNIDENADSKIKLLTKTFREK